MILASLMLLASASLPAGLSASCATGSALTQSSRVLGGYNAADVDDAQVQAAAAFAAESVGGELGEVTSAQVQSAAGANYKISFTTSDGRAYAAVVRRDLRGVWSVTSIEETGDHHTDIAQEQADRDEDNDD